MINREKSSILFSPNSGKTQKRQIKELWGLKSLKGDQTYLGNSLVMSRNLTKEFSKLKDRVQGKLEGWQSKLFLRVGKATLIRLVAFSILVYTMATFRIPKGVCNNLDAIVRHFWWGAKSRSNNYLALKSWDSICKNKAEGGLGFKKFHNFNLALLVKLGWMKAANENRLWVKKSYDL